MITSRDNPKVKWLRLLHDAKGRLGERCFLVEGAILVADALSAGLQPRLVLYDGAALRGTARGRRLLEQLGSLASEEAMPAVLQGVSDTVSPQGIVAAFSIPEMPLSLPAQGLVVVLDGVRDPGNVGTILRSALGAGCVAVIATPDTCDLFAPKVVRAAMGAHARLTLVPDADWPAIRRLAGERRIFVAEAGDGVPYDRVDWLQPAVLVIGNETEGPRPEALQGAAGRVSIPMPGRAESLNAAVAASIIIFEWVRQTRPETRAKWKKET